MLSNTTDQNAPGLTLKAWAFFSPAGTLIKQQNVSGVVKNSAGNYTVTFAAALATATPVVIARAAQSGGVTNPPFVAVTGISAAAVTVVCVAVGAQTDPTGGVWVGCYE